MRLWNRYLKLFHYDHTWFFSPCSLTFPSCTIIRTTTFSIIAATRVVSCMFSAPLSHPLNRKTSNRKDFEIPNITKTPKYPKHGIFEELQYRSSIFCNEKLFISLRNCLRKRKIIIKVIWVAKDDLGDMMLYCSTTKG